MQISNASSKDVLFHIFSHLNVRDLGIIARVCNTWNILSGSDEVWRKYQIYDDPTPSPIRKYTLMAMQRCFATLKKAKTIPDDLQRYGAIFSAASEISTWERYRNLAKGINFKNDYSDVRLDTIEACEMMQLVVLAFDCYLDLNKIGFMPLSKVEAFVRKTENVFQNPYPFKILGAKYLQLGDTAKAKEMHAAANGWEYPWF